MWGGWVASIVLMFCSGAAWAAVQAELEAGLLTRAFSDGTRQGEWSWEGYFEPRLKGQWARDSASFVLSGRARPRSESLETKSLRSQLEVRDSYMQWERGSFRSRLGFQSLSWGETFGFFIADLPNPRDLSDPLLLDLAYIKKPVLMAQTQWFGEFLGGASSVQVFAAPESPEAGIRVGRLFETGLDAALFAISHLDRTELMASSRVFSTGLTASQAISDQWVLRTDQVLRPKSSGVEWQAVGGVDWSPTGSFTLGAQLQHDPGLWGSSLRASYRGYQDRWDLDVFGFLGWQGTEVWVQPKLTYSHPSGLSLSLRYDWVEASSLNRGFLSQVPRADRGLLWISYRY